MVVMIEMDPDGRVPITTVGMLYKPPLNTKDATVRLQVLLFSVTKELEESLQRLESDKTRTRPAQAPCTIF